MAAAGESMEVDGGASPAPALRCEAAAASLPGAPGPSAAELDAQYVAELGPLALDTYDSTVPGGYFKEVRHRVQLLCTSATQCN